MRGPMQEDGEDLDDANLLELWPLHGKESYTDVNISKNLTRQQRRDIQELAISMRTYSLKDQR